ncbi:MAG: 3-oxoacyl-[acyl-carrier-protein] synthase III C-terminal domain-containing protein, partial [Pseudomonadota bacterium]
TERTMIGFMGCYAAINALRLARSIVRAEPDAHVLIVSVELCSLHLQETDDLEVVLSFMLFGDGCAAALVSARPEGLRLDGFRTAVMPAADDLITWHIGERGFDMRLSGEVPGALCTALPDAVATLEPGGVGSVDLWALHPGGRSILDAVERALDLGPDALNASRGVLRDYGNMSSPSVLFVLAAMMREGPAAGARGLAMAFGPGLTAEGMRFSAVA